MLKTFRTLHFLGLVFAFSLDMRILLILLLSSASVAQHHDTDCNSQHTESYHWRMESLISQLSKMTVDTQAFEKKREQLIEEHDAINKSCGQRARAPASVPANYSVEDTKDTENAEEFEEIE